jgi:hypothetical protein
MGSSQSAPPPPVNCTVSSWQPTGPCINGYRKFTRSVISPPQNGGWCPPDMEKTAGCDVSADLKQKCPDDNAIKSNTTCKNFIMADYNSGALDQQMFAYCDKPENFDDAICACVNSDKRCPQVNDSRCKSGIGYLTLSMKTPCTICEQKLDQKYSALSMANITQICNSTGNDPAKADELAGKSNQSSSTISFNYIFVILFIFIIIIAAIIYVVRKKTP